MANNSPNNPILEPGLSVRIIDGSTSQTNDTLYFIGTENNFRYKTHTTTKWDSKYKEKYSPNKNGGWRNKGQLRTREENKLLRFNILKEYGIK